MYESRLIQFTHSSVDHQLLIYRGQEDYFPELPDYCIFGAKLLTMLFVFLCICLLFS